MCCSATCLEKPLPLSPESETNFPHPSIWLERPLEESLFSLFVADVCDVYFCSAFTLILYLEMKVIADSLGCILIKDTTTVLIVIGVFSFHLFIVVLHVHNFSLSIDPRNSLCALSSSLVYVVFSIPTNCHWGNTNSEALWRTTTKLFFPFLQMLVFFYSMNSGAW